MVFIDRWHGVFAEALLQPGRVAQEDDSHVSIPDRRAPIHPDECGQGDVGAVGDFALHGAFAEEDERNADE